MAIECAEVAYFVIILSIENKTKVCDSCGDYDVNSMATYDSFIIDQRADSFRSAAAMVVGVEQRSGRDLVFLD